MCVGILFQSPTAQLSVAGLHKPELSPDSPSNGLIVFSQAMAKFCGYSILAIGYCTLAAGYYTKPALVCDVRHLMQSHASEAGCCAA